MKPALNDLNKVLTYHLEYMYDAEKKLQSMLPELLKGATGRALRSEIKSYIESAEDKRLKLKRIFGYLLAGPFGRKNSSIDKMLKEAAETSKLATTAELRDAALTGSLQMISESKIAAYHTALLFAERLGLVKVADLLSEILEWEKQTRQSLLKIALKGSAKKTFLLLA